MTIQFHALFNRIPLLHCASLLRHLLVGSPGSSPSCSWLTEVGPSLPREIPSPSGVTSATSVVTTQGEIWTEIRNTHTN